MLYSQIFQQALCFPSEGNNFLIFLNFLNISENNLISVEMAKMEE
jgi:hypothetical protein